MFTTGIPVVYASGLEPLAEYIADYIPLQRLDDRTWTAGAALRLSLDGTMDDESYRLTVTPQGVQVVGADYGGVFNGLQTLRNSCRRRFILGRPPCRWPSTPVASRMRRASITAA